MQPLLNHPARAIALVTVATLATILVLVLTSHAVPDRLYDLLFVEVGGGAGVSVPRPPG